MSVFVYERVLQLLEAEGIKTLFGIPDPSFFKMFACADARGWRVVAPHHEAAGAYMAEAMWRMTGKPGVTVGNQGPGVANLASAAVTAAKENSPVIFIAGQRKHIAEQRVRRGRFQYTRQWRAFEGVVKYLGIIQYAEQTDEIIQEAFRQALSGTPGPVYIEIPMDSMNAELDLPPPLAPEMYRLVRQDAGTSAIDAAAKLIRDARHPIILGGHGAFTARANDAVGRLARTLSCPVIQTFPSSPLIPGWEECTFPYGFSPAGVEAVAKSDVVIAIGTEIGETVHHGVGRHWTKGNVNRKWIYVEKDPLAIGVNRHIDVPLVGDLRDIIPQLIDAMKGPARARPPELDEWVKMHVAHQEQIRASIPITQSGKSIHTSRFIYEATTAVPQDSVLVRDGGAVNAFSWTYSQLRAHDVLWSPNFGHLGTGLPYAIGAQLCVGPKRRVVLVTGDSSFLYHISELETAVRKNLPVICIVGCDYAWGTEVRGYRAVIGPQSPETEAHWGKQVRMDKIAEGFGAHGEFVERAEDIAPAISRALASGKPAVIQVVIDGDANARDVPGHSEYLTWYTDFKYV